ncbi:MAG: hypothetical protein J0649_05845 [Methylococcales bacterium]|nr:hypothetical protein [Methylococcales bacterium]
MELKGEEKEIAEQHHKKWRIEQKEIEEEREKERFERMNRESSENSKRLYNQQKQYKEMLIDVQVEATRRFKTKQSIEQTKPIKKTKNEQRDDDFIQWVNEEKPDLESMTKNQVQGELIKRNPHLWRSGFEGWIKYTELYKGNAGRPKKQ